MSRSTIGDPSVRRRKSCARDGHSPRITSTMATGEWNSTGFSNDVGIGGIELESCIKLVLVGIAFLGLAIILTLWNSGRSLTPEEIRHHLLSSVEESKKNQFMASFRNKGNKLCLNDYNVINHEEQSVDFLRLQECKDFYAKDQFFNFKDDSLKVTRDSKKKDDILLCATVEYSNVKMVPCMSDDFDQLWVYMKNYRIYHYETRQCLSGRDGKDGKDGDLVTLEICDDKDANQVWEIIELQYSI